MHRSIGFLSFFTMLLYPIFSYSQVRICATNEQIQSFCNTSKVKVAFIFDLKVIIVDFSQNNPTIRIIANSNGATNPVISPDGSLVAYTTGIAEDPPVNGNANIFVSSLNGDAQPYLVVQGGFVPRFDYASKDTVLIYSTCGKPATGKANVWDGCGKVMKINLASRETTTLFEGGSYYGGLSFDGRYLSTAESTPNAFLLDLQNSLKIPAVLHKLAVKKIDTNEKVLIDIQTCNPSISSSRIFTNTMMYVDFSSAAIENAECYHPTLGYWDTHQRIFIGRNDGTILKYYDAPQDAVKEVPTTEMGKGEVYSVTWNHPEWTNHPYYATATINVDRLWKETIYQHTYRNEGLYLINLKDSSYLKLVEVSDTSKASTENILWPWIWIETPSNFAEIEDPNWLAPSISIKKRNYSHKLSSNIHFNKNLIKVDGELITQIRLFSHDGRQLWSQRYPNGQNTALLPLGLISGKLVLCDIALKSGKSISRPVSFMR